ncbi:hypothetical protein GW950_00420 [Candidatus Wolfebacteria bacterium]|nr:hypothetical protein [Candidatus Wolfebacteria bacterium]
MNKQEIKREYRKRIDILPENLKNEFGSDKTVSLIKAIGDKNNLNKNQNDGLAIVVAEIFLGFLSPAELVEELNYFNIDQEIAKKISKELDEKIFNRLRGDLLQTYNPYKTKKEDYTSAEIVTMPASEPKVLDTQKKQPEEPPKPLNQTIPHVQVQRSFQEMLKKSPTKTPATPTATPEPRLGPRVDLKKFEESKRQEVVKNDSEMELGQSSSPFILHSSDNTTEINTGGSSTKSQNKFKASPNLNIKIKNYSENNPSLNRERKKPEAVQLETPTNNKRIVHYNEQRTPINNLGIPKKDENTVDLRTFSKLDDNTVDLRK